jgi:uncharacterized protein with ATP-grasp and redox domains
MRQMKSAAQEAGADDKLIQEITRAAEDKLNEVWHEDLSPPEVSAPLYQMTGMMCGTDDPYLDRKIHYTGEALKLLPTLESLVRNAADPFDAAVRISIAGNVIDFGTGENKDLPDLSGILDQFLEKEMLCDDTRSLRELVSSAETVLFIGDNAGETVFDRPLLSILQADRLVYVTRGGPIINDVTLQDAVHAGIGLDTELMSSGSAIPGIVLQECSRDFQDLFNLADVVIAKGQGNFETLTELPRQGRTFMFFIVKCIVAARQVEGEIGDMVVMRW